jgi:dihydrofolate synthase/folylpolyglutamate synthase
VNLGLDRIERLLSELDHPERRLRGALVAGTNGKGSVVALVRAILQAAGMRVGTMPKPHLVSYRERIAVDGQPVSRERFAAAVSDVLPAADRVAARLGPPTEFEALTAAAFLELSRSGIDLAIVEVGLGGRLDATNAADLGVAVVTTVSHDHERLLGPTLARIGAEKAAIIKPGDLAVTGVTGRGLAPVLERAARVGAPLRRTGHGQPYHATLRSSGWEGILVDLATPRSEMRDVRVSLLGAHQAANAAVALAVVDALVEDAARRGILIRPDEPVLRRGLAAARWPGRLELLDGGRAGLGRVLLDGAHNPAGARALARALADLRVSSAPLVLGAMRDKQARAILRPLAAAGLRPVFTAVDDPHARPPADLLDAWRSVGGAGGQAVEGVAEALERAGALVRGDEPVVVAGSLYLVGAVRGMLTGEREG